MRLLASFAKDQSGAVTVDWVILTAGIIVMTLAIIPVIMSNVLTTSGSINTQVQGSVSN